MNHNQPSVIYLNLKCRCEYAFKVYCKKGKGLIALIVIYYLNLLTAEGGYEINHKECEPTIKAQIPS